MLPAQTLKITSPADGSIVPSGRDLTVDVDADSSQFRFIILSGTCFDKPVPGLARPPYHFTVAIPGGRYSGVCAISAIGAPNSGPPPAEDEIRTVIERPDLPHRLAANFSTLYLNLGETARNEIWGAFADDPMVLLTNSTYLKYATDAPDIVKVDVQGHVTGVAPGTTAVTVTYGSPSIGKISMRVPVHVLYPLIVSPPVVSLSPSQTEQFTAELNIDPRLDESVMWSISPGIGAISDSGLYTAPSSVSREQAVTVTATCVADPSIYGSARVRIVPRRGN
jgi:hypothetical protein